MDGSGRQTVTTMMANDYNPTAVHPREDELTVLQAAEHIHDAYQNAREEMKIFLKMIGAVDDPPQKANISASDWQDSLERWQKNVIDDFERMEKRINIGMNYLKAKNKAFQFEAERLSTENEAERLLLWKMRWEAEIEAAECKGGEPARKQAQKAFNAKARVIISCYELEGLWEQVDEDV